MHNTEYNICYLPVQAGCVGPDKRAKNFNSPIASAYPPWLASMPIPLYMAAARLSNALAIKIGGGGQLLLLLLVLLLPEWLSEMNEYKLGPTMLYMKTL